MENLVKLRKTIHKTQKELALDIGINEKAYWAYENGRNEPNIDTLIKIANYFNVSLDYLCGRQNKNLIFTDSLSYEKRQLIEMIKSLSDDETLIALGWMARLTNKPIEEIIKKIN